MHVLAHITVATDRGGEVRTSAKCHHIKAPEEQDPDPGRSFIFHCLPKTVHNGPKRVEKTFWECSDMTFWVTIGASNKGSSGWASILLWFSWKLTHVNSQSKRKKKKTNKFWVPSCLAGTLCMLSFKSYHVGFVIPQWGNWTSKSLGNISREETGIVFTISLAMTHHGREILENVVLCREAHSALLAEFPPIILSTGEDEMEIFRSFTYQMWLQIQMHFLKKYQDSWI